MTTTRGALLRAAGELLAAGGIPAVTLREVGRRAGVSHNAPYKHFASKEALLAELAAEELKEYARLAAEPDLRGALRAYVERAMARPELFRLVYGPWSDQHAALGEAAVEAWSVMTAAVRAAQDAGSLPAGDPDVLADLLRSTAHGAVELALQGHLSKGPRARRPDDVVQLLFDALRP